ncbi:MAG: molecular chaperone SurA [Thiothrix sp.]|nr:MAG: molecular chaperone SurA [Thiothrix sp.]
MATNSTQLFTTTWRNYLPAALLLGALASAMPLAQAEALDQIAVVVNSDVILASEVQQRMQMLRASKAGRGLAGADLTRAAIDELVTERLQAQYAKENGINVDDAMVDQAMESIARQNGMTMRTFPAALQKAGISMEALREQTRRKITADSLRKQMGGGKVAVSDQEVNDLIASQSQKITAGERYHLQHILVVAPNGATIEQVNAARIKAEDLRKRVANGEDFSSVAKQFSDNNAANKGGDLGWQAADALPSSFVRALSLMQVGDISPVVRDPNGFHVLKLLEREGGKRATASESRVRHILISTQKYSPAEAKQKIDALYEQLQAGADFAQLAKANSDDPGSATRGGDLGWAKAGQMVAAFEQTMNNQTLNTVSQPFQTQFGWHILEVLERKQADQSTDQIREKATNYLGGRKEEEQYKAWLQSLRNGAYIDYRMQGAAPNLQLK